MKIYSEEIIKNTFVDLSLKGFSLVINDTNYNNVYSIIVSFYNNSYSIKGFDFYERSIFNISNSSLSYLEFVKLNNKCYNLKIS